MKLIYGLILSLVVLITCISAASDFHTHEESEENQCSVCLIISEVKNQIISAETSDQFSNTSIIVESSHADYKRSSYISFHLSLVKVRGPPLA